jgi:arylsulfatase A-like enzyme/thioredoxin-like negative regulator of GroEL
MSADALVYSVQAFPEESDNFGGRKLAEGIFIMAGNNRKIIFLGLGAVIVLLVLAALLLFQGKGKEPFDGNLLVITLDTTRADSLGVYGGAGNHTPNLDRLARDGIMFKNCSTPVPLTLPAHASLFTGRTPLAHQVRNNGRYALAPRELTLAERLKPAGFQSYAVIASYVLLGRFGLKQGFDEYDDSLDSYKIMNSYNTEITADAVSSRFRAWLSKHKEDRFFAWVHFYDPHEPYAPPEEYRAGPDEKDPKSLYLGEVEFMDHHVGKILEELKALGLLANTLLVVVGDHGEAFAEHGEKGHAIFCYEENLRVPLIFFHETLLPKNAVVEERVSLVDILPTLLELYDLERGEDLQGRSLVPFFRPGTKNPPPRPLYMESLYGFEEMGWAPLTGIVEGDMKFVSLPRPEVYDLRQDPRESANLYEARPDLARRLKERLASFVSSRTEFQPETKRALTAEDIRQLQSLGYISSNPSQSRNNRDPKDGIVLDAKVNEFFKVVEHVPDRHIEGDIDRFLRDNGIDKSPALYARLWRLYEKRKNRDKVVETLREAMAAFPEEVGSQMQLAQVYSVMKKYDLVISLGRQILERDPANPVAHILMGDAYTALRNFDEAQVNLEKALKLEPENISLLIKYAELLISQGKIPEVLKVYDVLITKEDILKDHEFLYKLALFYAKNDNDRQAEELMKRCCHLHPSGRYYFYHAVILSRLENYEAAIKIMRVALEQHADELSPDQRAQAEKLLRSLSPGESVR